MKALYAGLALIAIAFGLVLYHRDVKDDLPRTKPHDVFGSLLGSRTLLIALAVGLLYSVWETRHDTLLLVLALPLNAMWLWIAYILNLNALARREKRSAQQAAGA